MPRTRLVSMDDVEIKIAPLSFDDVQDYIKTLKELQDPQRDPKPTEDDYQQLSLRTTVLALNKAAKQTEWSIDGAEGTKKLTAELDLVFINHLHRQILTFSGLTVDKPGEAPATSTGS